MVDDANTLGADVLRRVDVRGREVIIWTLEKNASNAFVSEMASFSAAIVVAVVVVDARDVAQVSRAGACSGGVVSGVEDEFPTARDLDARWVLCAKKASLDRIDETIAAGTISASTRAFATGVAFAARALRAARRVDLNAEDFVGSSASVPSDIVPSSHILAEVRRALIDAGAPSDIADDAPLMASGLASAGAAAAHAAMERAFGARLPRRSRSTVRQSPTSPRSFTPPFDVFRTMTKQAHGVPHDRRRSGLGGSRRARSRRVRRVPGRGRAPAPPAHAAGAARLQETLVHSLGRRLRRSLPATLAFDRPTVAALRAFLVDEGVGFRPNAESVAGRRAPNALPIAANPPDGSVRSWNFASVEGVAGAIPGHDTTGHDTTGHDTTRDDSMVSSDSIFSSDAVRAAPASRWDVSRLAVSRDAPPPNFGGFLADVDASDVELAGIARAEALAMDPQQRLVLDACAALFLGVFAGDRRAFAKACATFVGVSQTEYARVAEPHAPAYGPYHASGAHLSVVAGRVAFALALGGPAEAIDTACSSSLVAACRARQWTLDTDDASTDDPRGALAGGVNLTLDVSWSLKCAAARMLAPDGRCKTPDAAADGYVRAEACVTFRIRRRVTIDDGGEGEAVSVALAGAAANQDGRSSSLTAPNGPAQTAAIRAAMRSSRAFESDSTIVPSDVASLQMHGTGTALGDPIEIGAAAEALTASATSVTSSLVLGAVKSAVGHAEPAAARSAFSRRRARWFVARRSRCRICEK